MRKPCSFTTISKFYFHYMTEQTHLCPSTSVAWSHQDLTMRFWSNLYRNKAVNTLGQKCWCSLKNIYSTFRRKTIKFMIRTVYFTKGWLTVYVMIISSSILYNKLIFSYFLWRMKFSISWLDWLDVSHLIFLKSSLNHLSFADMQGDLLNAKTWSQTSWKLNKTWFVVWDMRLVYGDLCTYHFLIVKWFLCQG